RPVQVERIPEGSRHELPPGTMGQVTQALGSHFTLLVEGQLVRLRGEDADAIGREVPVPVVAEPGGSAADLETRVWDTLRTCYVPEIPVDIVELGLIYACDMTPMDASQTR